MNPNIIPTVPHMEHPSFNNYYPQRNSQLNTNILDSWNGPGSNNNITSDEYDELDFDDFEEYEDLILPDVPVKSSLDDLLPSTPSNHFGSASIIAYTPASEDTNALDDLNARLNSLKK
eukprot:TRINITY_DN2953_c0_g1_i1.p2 TRINITY_DN2953_c0_g1~~TRINITY_DN2953_c0_g1_i1.p2  ORF type:complete len:118 (-),score=27.40 TRINITY_DN2953_c0_g1_i1:707-1060(-)